MRKKCLDILFWAALKPIKSGTFEDYVLGLTDACKTSGLSIKVVLRDPIAPEVESRFKRAGLDFELLNRSYHGSGLVLAKYLFRTSPQVLHIHFYGAGSFLLFWARLTSRAKILLHDHSSRPTRTTLDENGRGALKVLRSFKRRVFTLFIDYIIAVSKFVENTVHAETNIPQRKIRLICNGVDTDRFHPVISDDNKQWEIDAVLGRCVQNPIVTFVGVLSDDKGVGILLDTIDKLSKEGVGAHYIIVGDGPLRGEVESKVDKLGPDVISYLGIRNDVDRILRASDVFIAPYLWEEAFGLTLAEAASSGIPIIASDVGGITEVIGSDEGGVIIKPNDIESLGQAIKRLVTNDGLRHQLSKQARNRAERLYSLDNMVTATIELYQECINEKK